MSFNDEYFDIGCWTSQKLKYHKISNNRRVKNLQINHGEIWYCDLGFNIGAEKNKMRPVLVISNNNIGRTGKVVVICLTDTSGKLNAKNLPAQDSWYLLYSDTTNPDNMCSPNRIIPKNNTPYDFLEKDSMVQCEEIRTVSKARFNTSKGRIGAITSSDLEFIKKKFKRTYNL